MNSIYSHSYQSIISIENLLAAWKEFVCGKRARKDVQLFERNLMANLLDLHHDLLAKTYRHGPYDGFKISDPKPRHIHKATVRDRVVHRALYRSLYPFFDRTFIAHSYSCRRGKGTHKALRSFDVMGRKVSRNHTKTVWVLKCDIQKCFASIDHDILIPIIKKYIRDADIIWLLAHIIESFSASSDGAVRRILGNNRTGLPLGNLTSQLLVNLYMNRFDMYVKHILKAHSYIRYADDFVIMSQDKTWLENILIDIKDFLRNELHLNLHPHKVSIATIASGIDFLGWIHFPDHKVLRTTTKRRMLRCVKASHYKKEVVRSYRGLLSHGNAFSLQQTLPENTQNTT